MNILVTGGTGFIGSHLVEALTLRGHAVRCLVRRQSSTQWLDDAKPEYAYGDLFTHEALDAAVAGVDMIYHVAGLTAARNRAEFFRGNAEGTKNLLDAVVRTTPSLKKFVHVSSLAAIGPAPDAAHPVTEDTPAHPITSYGESKHAAEEECYARMGTLPITIVRPPAVYGPRDVGIYTFFQTVAKGIAPLIGFGKKHVSLVYCRDLVDGIILAGESERSAGESFFIGSERTYTWHEVGALTARVMGKRFVPIPVPHAVVYAAAALSEFFGRFATKPPIFNFEKGRDIVQPAWVCSDEKARRMLGYTQRVSLEDGVRETVLWYIQKGWL